MIDNPIDNLTFDWLTVLQNKAQGIHAYDKYIEDARTEHSDECVSLFEELRAADIQLVGKIKEHIQEKFVKERQASMKVERGQRPLKRERGSAAVQ